MKSLIKIIIILALISQGCSSKITLSEGCLSKPIKHDIFDELLAEHVSESGEVDYQGFISDSLKFNSYLALVEANHPTKQWADNEVLAYWINAYNAYTVQFIIRNYPVNSIKELGGSIYQVNTPWDNNFITICGQSYNLNNLEHGKIRKQFEEPRIHFAVNCASFSCPKLLNEAFMAETLDAQLDKATRGFIANTAKNKINSDKIEISKLFKWYAGDFKVDGKSVLDFINAHSDVQISADAEVTYMDYNWSLNDVKR